MDTTAERLRQIADDLQQLTWGLRDTGIMLSLVAAQDRLRALATELEQRCATERDVD